MLKLQPGQTVVLSAKKFGKPGNCYENSYNWLLQHPKMTLVHGLVWNPKVEAYMGHAWLEEGSHCFDAHLQITLPKELYYAVGRIEYTKRYTLKQAINKALSSGHYGAWDSKIKTGLHRPLKPKKTKASANNLPDYQHGFRWRVWYKETSKSKWQESSFTMLSRQACQKAAEQLAKQEGWAETKIEREPNR